jgi:small subunit ribosomal protein S4
VYRLGFADSRKQARQIVRHGHFTVNGRKTNIPSFIVKPEDLIAVRTQSREREYFKIVAETIGSKQTPDWLTREVENLNGRVVSAPTRDQIEIPPVNEQLVVEFYSR